MAIHNLYIFDRNGSLLFYTEWNRLKQSGMSREEALKKAINYAESLVKAIEFLLDPIPNHVDVEAKLMYGMLFSIKSFVSKISPLDLKKGFLCYKTNKYALHYMETPTGLKFVLNTDIHANEVRELMNRIYSQVYVEYIAKNPVCKLDEPIKSELFKEKLDELVKQSTYFTAKIA